MTTIYKLSQNDPISLSGDAVDKLIRVVHDLSARGAPDTWDDQGFGKLDWESRSIQYIKRSNPGDSLPDIVIADAVTRLAKYEFTQLEEMGINYNLLKSEIQTLKTQNTATPDDDRRNFTDKIVQSLGKGDFGKKRFLIPNFNRGIIRLKRLIKPRLEEMYNAGVEKYKQRVDYGKLDWPVFMVLQRQKSPSIDTWDINSDVKDIVADFLEGEGYDVLALRDFGELANAGAQQVSDDGGDAGVEGGDYVATEDSGPLFEVYSVYDQTDGRWMIGFPRRNNNWTPEQQTKFNQIVTDLFHGETHKSDEFQDNMQLASQPKYNKVRDGYKWKWVKVHNELGQQVWENPEGVPDFHKFLRGDINALFDLGIFLKRQGFNVSKLRDVVRDLRAKGAWMYTAGGRTEEEHIRGNVDGYTIPEFESASRLYEPAFFEGVSGEDLHFYKAQMEGIQFLYSRQSAILGDDTGVGKTIQCIVAADLRLKQRGGKCVIVTVPAVIDQYMEEIKKVTGLDESDVSDDVYSGAKYRVLGYSTFSTRATRDESARHLIEEASAGVITVMILDEIHATKSATSARSALIGEITKFVPFVWGASATTVANTPTDLHRQLSVIGHNFGKMPYKKFDAIFGSKRGGRKLPKIEQYKRADRIKDILLTQGVYTRRSKEAIREDMPEQIISESTSTIDHSELNRRVADDMRGKADLPVVQLGAFRKVIAEMKVPHSLFLAKQVLDQGKKVAIFTASVYAGNLLEEGINRMFREAGITNGVARIKGNMTKDSRTNTISGFKDLENGPRAIIIAIKAGGTGLDFPNILTDVIINDFEWSVKDDDQSLGRFYRINSQKDINVVYNISDTELDISLYQQLADKKEIASRIKDFEKQDADMVISGISSEDPALAALRIEKYKAYAELEEKNKQITENFGGKDAIASYVFTPRKSWYGLLKTNSQRIFL